MSNCKTYNQWFSLAVQLKLKCCLCHCAADIVVDSCGINLAICMFCWANTSILPLWFIIDEPWASQHHLRLCSGRWAHYRLWKKKSCGVLVNRTMVRSLSPLSVHLRFVPLTPRPCHYTTRPNDENTFSNFQSFRHVISPGSIHGVFFLYSLSYGSC